MNTFFPAEKAAAVGLRENCTKNKNIFFLFSCFVRKLYYICPVLQCRKALN